MVSQSTNTPPSFQFFYITYWCDHAADANWLLDDNEAFGCDRRWYRVAIGALGLLGHPLVVLGRRLGLDRCLSQWLSL